MTYTDAINGLMSICETVCENYEYAVMTEAAESDKTSYVEKCKKVLKKIWAIVQTALKKIQAAFAKIAAFAKASDMTVDEDCELSEMVINPSKAISVIVNARHALRGKGINSADKDAKIISDILNLMNKKTVKAGTKLANNEVYVSIGKALEELAKNGSDGIDNIRPDTPVEELTYKNELYGTVAKMYTEFLSSYNKLVPVKPKNTVEVTNESVGLNKDAAYTYASLLIEAANVLKSAGIISEDANSTTDLTAQKAIDDIPEETPVENKEYPEDTSGGPGKKEDCLEDTKDLVDGDSKAIDLLTKNDQSKTITESIDLVFDL